MKSSAPEEFPNKPLILPDGYHLDHFRQFIAAIRSVYFEILTPDEQQVVLTYHALSEAEQRLFARLSNRKGSIFFRSALKYPEIDSLEETAERLIAQGFARRVQERDFPQCMQALTKRQLLKLLKEVGSQSAHHSLSKSELQALSSQITYVQFTESTLHTEALVRCYSEELRYFCFLAFVDLESDVKLYALRDLGIRHASARPLTSRFASAEAARSEFYYRCLREFIRGCSAEQLARLPEEIPAWPPAAGPGAGRIRNKLLFDAAQTLQRNGKLDLALKILSFGDSDRIVEKRIRALYSLGRIAEAQNELQSIFEAPISAPLLLFAEDFGTRKFGRQKKSAVTLALEQARTIRLDARHRGRPELGVAESLQLSGTKALHVENHVWRMLFGLVFWEDLFERNAALHSEFDLFPADLAQGTFYSSKYQLVEARLELIARKENMLTLLADRITRSIGTPNGIFSWNVELIPQLCEFIEAAYHSDCDVRPVLLAMARDFSSASSGFPDLLVLRSDPDGLVTPAFIEVKALGDRLQRSQLQKIRLLSDCGFSTEIVRVEWDYDPAQTYVVVDVETTGLSPDRNRITEFAAVKFRGGEVIDEFSTLVNPQCRIPRQIVALTGITDAMVAGAPAFEEIGEHIEQFTAGSIFVAHNARFDYGFVSGEFRRFGRNYRRPVLCTAVELRRVYPDLESYSLDALCREFGVGLERHHRALSDARATTDLLRLTLQSQRECVEQSIPS